MGDAQAGPVFHFLKLAFLKRKVFFLRFS